MTKLRTYLVRFDGHDRIVKAATPARAERHVLAVELAALRKKLEGEARVANGIEVADFVAGGGRIETEGEEPVPARAPLLESLTPALREISAEHLDDEVNNRSCERCGAAIGEICRPDCPVMAGIAVRDSALSAAPAGDPPAGESK